MANTAKRTQHPSGGDCWELTVDTLGPSQWIPTPHSCGVDLEVVSGSALVEQTSMGWASRCEAGTARGKPWDKGTVSASGYESSGVLGMSGVRVNVLTVPCVAYLYTRGQ
jgi:hypothetical protein